jgi:hypothetical protein
MDPTLALYALVFFGLGFAAGLIVASLRKETKTEKSGPADEPGVIPQAQTIEQVEQLPPALEIPTSPPPTRPVRWVSSSSTTQARPAPATNRDVMAELAKYVLPKEQPKPPSMVEEIDGLVQEMLALSPLKGRDIRLLEQPDHGLQVVVDGEVYNGVNEVRDEGARQLIQQAVAEWQRRARQRLSP